MSFPVAFFAYNRPQHTLAALQALASNPLAAETTLCVFCDGPASAKDLQAVKQVRGILESTRGFRDVRTYFNENNKGTVGTIVLGMSRILREFDAAIMVEDDAVVSRHFLTYMNRALRRYDDVDRVMSVSAYMFRTVRHKKLPETFFYRKGTSFAWGTWSRAWAQLSMDCSQLLEELANKDLESYLDGTSSFKLSSVLRRDAERTADDPAASWSPRWFASMVLSGGLTLYPRQSLVKNIGFDGSGVRSPTSNAWDVDLNDFCPTEFPAAVTEHPLAHDIMTECYAAVDATRSKGGSTGNE